MATKRGSLLLVILIGLTYIPGAQATSPWVLTNDATDIPGDAADYHMQNGGTMDGKTSITEGQSLTWVSEVAAVSGLDMSGQWSITLTTDGPGPTIPATLQVGKYDDGQPNDCNVAGTGTTATGNVNVATLTFAAGERICIVITAATDAVGNSDVNLDSGSGSTVAAPAGEPGYPTPLLATIALLGAGALMVVGVVYARPRQ